MKRSRASLGFRCGAWLALASAACGGRSELPPGSLSSAGSGGNGTGGMGNLTCILDLECGESDACSARRCVDGLCTTEATRCDDGDVCTEDTCDVVFGCGHRELALDADDDGFTGPRAGFAPGDRDSCGLDCNDRSAVAFPGNEEVCDGVDNDCNGVVDDGMTYVASKIAPIRVSTPMGKRASRGDGGLVATPDGFVLTYSATVAVPGNPTLEVSRALLKGLRADGSSLFESDLSEVNSDTYAGALAWSGDVLASAWDDARHGNYEVFLGRFGAKGEKLAPDQRVTDAPGFSKNPYIAWNQSEFVLAWDDRRREGPVSGDSAAIFGQRAAADGTLLGANLPLVEDALVNESPVMALSPQRLGLVYTVAPSSGIGTVRLGFRALDAALGGVGTSPEPIGVDVQSPTVHFVRDRFVVLWELYPSGGSPGEAIWGAAFDLDGRLLLQPRPVTSGARFARFHDALSLGDRLLVMWTDDRDGNYEIYWQILSPDLGVIEQRQRLTFSPSDSLGPALAVGPDGKIGVLFSDSPEGSRQVYFTTLECGLRTN